MQKRKINKRKLNKIQKVLRSGILEYTFHTVYLYTFVQQDGNCNVSNSFAVLWTGAPYDQRKGLSVDIDTIQSQGIDNVVRYKSLWLLPASLMK